MGRKGLWLFILPLLCGLPLLTAAAASLPTGYLLPGGGVKLDRQALANPPRFCALTFDDGPDSKYTQKVADILDRRGVKATFFVVGTRVKQYPEQVKQLHASGHEIANHSWSHPDFTKLSASGRTREIERTSAELGRLGITPKWFRPPFGAFNRGTTQCVKDCGLTSILWSVDPRDWQSPGADRIVSRVVSGTGNGAVILLHSTNAQTVEALPRILDELSAQGYKFLTMTQWAQAAAGRGLPAAQEAAPLRFDGDPPSLRNVAPGGHAPVLLDEPRPAGALDSPAAAEPALPELSAPVEAMAADPAWVEQMEPTFYEPFPAAAEGAQPVRDEPLPDAVERPLRLASSVAHSVRDSWLNWLAVGGDAGAGTAEEAAAPPAIELPYGAELHIYGNFDSPAGAEHVWYTGESPGMFYTP